ncbi:MAG: cation acetate symporter [Pirellulaceae bacterium]|nr:cation acetate symporter [Pirellulaceae bacterium]
MIYEFSFLAVSVFALFVAVTLGISFYLGGKAQSSAGYFAAHGQIPWFVNGVAFAGDYLSAASFLGICGMIATAGYDGFLYSIGFLAGWVVALFVIAEPMKRLGKFTFADALDAKFGSRGIRLAAGISTLAVSIFYLIPQMVGAGALVQPLLNFPHWAGVVMVGTVVILIVVTAGMVSTTWVQFLKGTLLVFFSGVLTVLLLFRGFNVTSGGNDGHTFARLGPIEKALLTQADLDLSTHGAPGYSVVAADDGWQNSEYVRLKHGDELKVFSLHAPPPSDSTQAPETVELREAQTVLINSEKQKMVNGRPMGRVKGEPELYPVGHIEHLAGDVEATGPLGPLEFFRVLRESRVVLWRKGKDVTHDNKTTTSVYIQKPTEGAEVLRPGESAMFKGIRGDSWYAKLNFISLMMALFCGTASLPHILIRYYTVRDAAGARNSTIVGIASIGLFYVLTLYLGLGAMTSGAMDVTNENMSAPLLAKSLNQWLFAIISAIAFTTVLGTVSGLILAASGAVTHDLLLSVAGVKLTEHEQVRVAKITSVAVGILAIGLGIWWEKLNVGFLVGWAFSVAASANLPALVMLLFWKGTTRQGVIASVVTGMLSSLTWILLSSDTYEKVYGWPADQAPMPFSQPGIVTIPLAFAILVIVSLATQKRTTEPA